jgi:hypothetical protein
VPPWRRHLPSTAAGTPKCGDSAAIVVTLGSDEIDITEILGSNHTAVNEQVHTTSSNDGCSAPATDVSQTFHLYDL